VPAAAAATGGVLLGDLSSLVSSPYAAHGVNAAPAPAAAAAVTETPVPAAVPSSQSRSPFEAIFSPGAAAVDTPVPALPGGKLPKAASSTVKSPFEASGALLLADLIGDGPGVGLPAGAAT
jgi:hypothetical protein